MIQFLKYRVKKRQTNVQCIFFFQLVPKKYNFSRKENVWFGKNISLDSYIPFVFQRVYLFSSAWMIYMCFVYLSDSIIRCKIIFSLCLLKIIFQHPLSSCNVYCLISKNISIICSLWVSPVFNHYINAFRWMPSWWNNLVI